LFFYGKFEKGKYNNPKIDIKKRTKRLLVPYLVACLTWVIPFYIYFYEWSWIDIIKKFLLMISPAQLWFLPMLFWTFLVFLLVGDKLRFNRKEFIIIFSLSIITNAVLGRLNIAIFQINSAVKYIPYYYLGGYIYKKFNDKKYEAKDTIIFITILVIFAVLQYISKFDVKYLKSLIGIFEEILMIFAILHMFIILKYIYNKVSNIEHSKIYELLKENTFGIYLFHQQIIYITIILFNGLVHPLTQVLLSFVISVSISLIMVEILKKNKITKFLFGL
jgi:surface polysaccharide O-acyltransferase-like enzyme